MLSSLLAVILTTLAIQAPTALTSPKDSRVEMPCVTNTWHSSQARPLAIHHSCVYQLRARSIFNRA